MDVDFESSLSYALSCLKLGDITQKDKKMESIRCTYEGKDVFLWLPTGYGKSQCLPFCLIISLEGWSYLLVRRASGIPIDFSYGRPSAES